MAADWDGLGWTSLQANARDAGSADGGLNACDDEGASIECGKVTERYGNYVTCSMGHRTCTNGVWSACLGTRRLQQ